MQRVFVLIYDGVQTLDATGPAEVFAAAMSAPVFATGQVFRFSVACDEFAAGQEAALIALAHTLPANATVEIHGYASTDGDPTFNQNLSCARALKARSVLTAPGPLGGALAASQITGLFNHGPTPGPATDRRSVVIKTNIPPVLQKHSFRVAAASFLSCALCNPFTDDGSFGITPPVTEPAPGSSFRQLHFIEAELGTFDNFTIQPGSARIVGSGNLVGLSGYCGRSTRGHIVTYVGPTITPIFSLVHGEGLQLESEMESRVGAVVPPNLPGAPCGFLGTNPLIPVIGNRFRMRLFADGTEESEFRSASLYPSHFLYDNRSLKMFGGAPVRPRQDFYAWSTSVIPSMTVAETGLKALRFACCHPVLSSFFCDTTCRGGFSVPSMSFDPINCAAYGAALTAGSCPPACGPAGGACPPLVRPSNP